MIGERNVKGHSVRSFQAASPNLIFAMSNSDGLEQSGKKSQTPQGRRVAFVVSLAFFFVVSVLLYPRFGLPVIAVGIIPLLVGAWFYGVWAGILFALLLYAADIAIITFLGWERIQVAARPGALLGLATGVITCAIVGRMGKVARRNQEEFRQRMSLFKERDSHFQFHARLSDILLAAAEMDGIHSMLKVLLLV